MRHEPRILVLDGYAPVGEIIARLLRRMGYAAVEAPDVPVALAMAGLAPPDLIILDPFAEGFCGASALERRDGAARVPGLILSDTAHEEGAALARDPWALEALRERLEAFNLGVVDVVTKPVSVGELARRVRRLLWMSGWESEATHQGACAGLPGACVTLVPAVA